MKPVPPSLLGSDEIFRLMVESAKDYAIFTTDGEGRVTTWNAGAERVLGYTQDEILGGDVRRIFTPEDNARGRAEYEMAEALRTGRAEDRRWHLHRDGRRIWADGFLMPLKDDEQDVIGFLKIVRDRTADKRSDDDRDRAESDLRQMLESATDFAIFTLTPENRVASWNRGAMRLFGYPEEEILGRGGAELFVPEDRAAGMPEWEVRTAADAGRAEDERWHRRKDGSRFFASGVCSPIRDEYGSLVGFTKICRDITERKLAADEFAQQSRENRVQAKLLDLTHVMVRAMDGKILFWNRGTEALYGWTKEEAIGQVCHVLLKARFPEPYPEIEARLLRDGHWRGEVGHARKDGREIVVASAMTLHEGEHGRVVLESNVDITERKEAEAERERLFKQVRAERERLGNVFHLAPSFLAVLRGPNHVFELVNERYYQLVGHREVLGKPAREALPEVEGQGFFELLDGVYQTGEPFVGTGMGLAVQVRPGHALEERFVDFVFQPVREPDGGISGILAHGVDLTERRRAEDQLRESEERYRTLFNSIDEGFCVIEMLYDRDGKPSDYRFLEVNPAFERQSRMRDVLGKRMRELAPGHEPHWFETYGRVAETGEAVRFENEARTLGGLWFDVYAFRLGAPEQRRVAVLFTDITERKELERSLRHRVRDLADADRRKNEFLAMLAHELRNPLSGISGAIRLARRPGLEDQVPYAHDVIERQAGNLARLIDDLLDVSRITQGKVELRREVVEVAAVVNRAAESVRAVVEQRRHELTIQVTAGPIYVDADPTRLEQILVNLLTNAAKYTEEGGRITASARKQAGRVVLAVKDTGVGIAPDMLPKVFDLFTQVDRSLARSEGGLGIGLTLVKQLVEMHGGTVAAASAPGEGSEFTVRLPLVERPHEEPRAAPRGVASGLGKRLLVVDDNADTARLTGRMLQSMGFAVQVVHDGQAALDAARLQRPEVVLLDIGLPGMDGFAVARQLRREECCRHALIVGISGYGDVESREEGREAGFDHHLVKPVDIDSLLPLIARSTGRG